MLHVSEVATERGPLFRVRILGNEIDPASGLDLFAAVGHEIRFGEDTHPDPGTTRNDEPDWRKAHGILLPASSPPEPCPLTAPASTDRETNHEQVTAAGRGVLDLLERHRAATAGDTLQTRVQTCGEACRLPVDDSAPAILVSAGTGPAPFRGAVLDRLRTRSTGTLLCFFDSDHPDADYPHREEFEAAEVAGAVSMRPAFSQGPQGGTRFVQDRIAKESHEVWAVLEGGGRIHICGDEGRRTLPAVREAFMAVYREYTGAGKEESTAWLYALVESGYYVENVRAEPHSLMDTATR
ncbi:hypothetical protein [Streptomyces sp. NBC_00459]|uniref:hypothetical protein n=1 Tax=Streptomyces sp. NBC_00459 TaxID=2975749 RepID=UPI002E17FAD3